MGGRGRAGYGRLQRYVAGEFLYSLLVAFLFFFIVFFVNQLLLMAEDVLARKAPPRDVALLLLYATPSVAAISFPFASLVGGLMASGRLAADREIAVMRASGVPGRKILAPFVLVGLLVSGLSFAMNDYFLPAGVVAYGRLYRRLLVSAPSVELRPYSSKRYRDVTLVTGPVEGELVRELLIFDRTKEGKGRVISAREARLAESGSRDSVLLLLEGVWTQTMSEAGGERFEYSSAASMEYRITLRDGGEAGGTVGPREMASADLYRAIVEKRAALDGRRERRAAEVEAARSALAAAYEGLTLARGAAPAGGAIGDVVVGAAGAEPGIAGGAAPGGSAGGPSMSAAEGSSPPPSPARTGAALWEAAGRELARPLAALRELEAQPPGDRSLQIYLLEFHKKFAIPFGALCFVFLAYPLGAGARRAGRGAGFGVGLLVSVLYWALLLGGQTLGTRLSWSPFWAMWAPNAIALASGLALMALRRAAG